MSAADDGRPILLEVVRQPPTVRVTLQIDSQRHVGVAEAGDGADAEQSVASAARATLDALQQATPMAVDLRLDWSGIVDPGEGMPQLVVVLVTAGVVGVPLRASGSVLLRDHAAWAGARAALQALNRRLGVLGL